jgi:hypothetical protein
VIIGQKETQAREVTSMQHGSSNLHFIDRELRRIELRMNQVNIVYPLNAIPDDLYEGIACALESSSLSETGLASFYRDTLLKPVMCTFDASSPFPVNAAVKVVRLTLKDEVIEDGIDDLEGEVLALQGMPFNETIEDRIEIYRKLYLKDKDVDRFRLGAVEMFGDVTYRNIQRDPRVSLNFYWHDPKSTYMKSYQINAIAEISHPGTPYYRFMRLMRSLFSTRFIETRRDSYVVAYKLWVSEVLEKTLAPKTGFVPEDTSN